MFNIVKKIEEGRSGEERGRAAVSIIAVFGGCIRWRVNQEKSRGNRLPANSHRAIWREILDRK